MRRDAAATRSRRAWPGQQTLADVGWQSFTQPHTRHTYILTTHLVASIRAVNLIRFGLALESMAIIFVDFIL